MGDLVYLACPYSHDDPAVRLRRFEAANAAAAGLMRAGLLVFSPISHAHPIAEYGLPLDWGFWRRFDMGLLKICRAMVVLQLDGWKESVGVQAEIGEMRFLKRLVLFVVDGRDADCVVECLGGRDL